MQWNSESSQFEYTVYYQPTTSISTVLGSSGLLVGENDLISFNTSQHYAIMCLRINNTDGPTVGILPVSFLLAPIKPHKSRAQLCW